MLKQKTFQGLVFQKIWTYRHDIKRFPKLEFKKYFQLMDLHIYRQIYTYKSYE